MKRILSLVLAMVMVLGSFSAVFAAEQTAAEKAGAFLKEAKVLIGNESGDLNLDEDLKREEAIVVLSRLMGVEETAKGFPTEGLKFEDITNEGYKAYISWAVANELTNGKTETKFGFKEPLTAQHFAMFVLRALGYGDVEYANAFEKAVELGILADLDVEKADTLVRGDMAVMTVNALSVTVKDSTKTLAETLEIEMPVAPAPAKATKVEKVYADNLKEVVVVFNGEVEKTDAEKVTNYKLNGEILGGNVSAELQEDGKTVVINFQNTRTLQNQKAYKLAVSGIEGISVVEEFTVLDVTVPEVVGVQAVGNRLINVTFSEPVTQVSAETRANYRLNGYVVNGTLELSDDGRVLSISLYTAMKAGENKLSVTGVRDYANMTIINYLNETFTVVDDKVAPASFEITTATLDYVIIKFNEPVQTVGSAYWSDNAGTTKHAGTITANNAAKDEYRIEFNNTKLPARETTLYVEKAKDFSGNEAAKLSASVNAIVDTVRPEILSLDFAKNNDGTYKSGNIQLELKMNKKIDTTQFTGANNENLIVKNAKGVIVATANTANYKVVGNATDYNTILVDLTIGLTDDTAYTVEVKNVVDSTALNNKLIPQTFSLVAPLVTAPTVTSVVRQFNSVDGTTIQVSYSNEMQLDGEYSILARDRYMIQVNSSWYMIPEEASFEPTYDNKAVIIRIPADAKYNAINTLDNGANTVSGVKVTLVADKVGNRLAGLTTEVTGGNVSTNAAQMIVSGDHAPVATAKDTVVVKFDRPLSVVYKEDFTVNGVMPKAASYETVGGRGVVTFTLADNAKLNAAANNGVGVAVVSHGSPASTWSRDLMGTVIGTTGNTTLVDGIVPSLVADANSPVQVTAANEITLTFDEVLQPAVGGMDVAPSFVVTYGINNTKLVPSVDYTATASGTTVVITVTKSLENVTNLKVATNNDLMFVYDQAGAVADSNKVKFAAKAATYVAGIVMDTKAPVVSSVSYTLATAATYAVGDKITIKFSENIDASAILIGDITEADGTGANTAALGTATLTPATGNVNELVITLAADSDLESGNTLTIDATKVLDAQGNPMAANYVITLP